MTDVYAWRKIGDFFSSEDVGKTYSQLYVGSSDTYGAYYPVTNKVLISGQQAVKLNIYQYTTIQPTDVIVTDVDDVPTKTLQAAATQLKFYPDITPKTYLDQKVVFEVKNTRSLSDLLDVSTLSNINSGSKNESLSFIYTASYTSNLSYTAGYVYLCKSLVDGAYSPVIAYAELNDDATSLSDYTIKTFIPSSSLANKLIGGEWVQIEFSAHDGGSFLGQDKWAVNTLKIDGQTAFSNVRLKTDLYGNETHSASSRWQDGFFLYINTVLANNNFPGLTVRADQLRNYSVWIMYQTTPRSPTITIQKSGTTTITLTAVVDTDPSISEAVSYRWSTGETSASITLNIPNDNDIHRYTCTATDSAGQSVTGEYTIYNPSIEFYSLLWNTGETTETIYPDADGTYSCTVTNSAGSATASIYVETGSMFKFKHSPLQISYGLSSEPNVIRTAMYDGRSRQRIMTGGKKYKSLKCQFIMTETQLEQWIDNWKSKLHEGEDWFLLKTLGEEDFTEYKTVRLNKGEWSAKLKYRNEIETVYDVTMNFEVK